MTAAGFLWKISAGGSAMMRSRDLMLINDGLDLTRKFSLFYGSAGYHLKLCGPIRCVAFLRASVATFIFCF
jgi:hypothetical protein